MRERVSDVKGGVESFLEEQRVLPGTMTLSVSMFDGEYTTLTSFSDIQTKVDMSTYSARGSTALYDSLSRLVTETGDKLAAMAEEDRPSTVIVMIFTDGVENASREVNVHDLRKQIALQKDTYNWQFMFIGADQDAVLAGANLGIRGIGVSGSNMKGAMEYTSAYVGTSRVADVTLSAELSRGVSVEDVENVVRAFKQKHVPTSQK